MIPLKVTGLKKVKEDMKVLKFEMTFDNLKNFSKENFKDL